MEDFIKIFMRYIFSGISAQTTVMYVLQIINTEASNAANLRFSEIEDSKNINRGLLCLQL